MFVLPLPDETACHFTFLSSSSFWLFGIDCHLCYILRVMSLILQMTSFVYFWLSYLFAFVDSLDLEVFVVPGGVKILRQGCVSRMPYLDAYCRFVLILGGFLFGRCGVCSGGMERVCPVLRDSRPTISCRNFGIRNSPWDSRAVHCLIEP